jgi:hypothetical protein
MGYSTSWVEGKKKGLGIGRDDQKLGFCNLQPATFLASTGTEQTPTGLTGLDYRHWMARKDTATAGNRDEGVLYPLKGN